MKKSYTKKGHRLFLFTFLISSFFLNFKASAQYCMSGLGGISCGSTLYEQIVNVSITGTTLNNSDSICTTTSGSTLKVFSPVGSSAAVLARGNQYVLKVTTSFVSIISVWIDYDQDSVFDAGSSEWKRITINSVPNVADSVILNVPPNAPTGQTRMRIRTREDGFQNDSSSACATFASGETEDYYINIDFGLDVSGITKNNTLNAVPNPATDKLAVSFTNHNVENSFLKLVNLSGQVVYSEALNRFVGNYSGSIDLSSFAKGIYSLQLISDSGITNKKVVIK